MRAGRLPVLHESLRQRLLERALIVVEQDTEQPLVRCQCANVVQPPRRVPQGWACTAGP